MVTTKEYTRQEVALRDGKNGAQTWIIIRDVVYDVTTYLEDHPGGGELITEFAGKDGTRDFDDFGHSGTAMNLLKQFKIGELNMCDRAKFQKQGSEWLPDGACVLPPKKRSKRRRFIFCG
ncbi:cytochrome b5-like isoform X2 [Toxorhynchites rutilus septentrionalis]|uniref:cytochrome b5-like isoform X2 n=1 Tax=Toxorhynchites rutilus septentrionalis TaxID=329112 RepID=UPI00247B2D20|nr:cytochrome b5-like isoform X2 [Toxorhynchites rutilus septentrionalis]XP_055627593.1 cytochrome b5-like isoform X2 [Toxorhynchites rutilus septentrionalis]